MRCRYDYARLFKSMAKPAFVFDGRGILPHEKLRAIGFTVYAIGKSSGQFVDMNAHDAPMM
jgi:UDPglucose 6-dehydrogenase